MRSDRRTRTAALALAFALGASGAAAADADTAREKRWADEIVPQLVVGDAIWLATPRHPRILALFAEPAARSRNAIIVVHGLGVHPDWNLIGVLRSDLVDRGFATLSVQMPVLAADAPRGEYPTLFGDAAERLTTAASWLRARGYTRIGVVSHSMGAAMVNAWLANAHDIAVDAWVPVGMMTTFDAPPRETVLDVVAERDFPEALSASKARASALPRDGCSTTLSIADTDHYFENAASRLAAQIAPFLSRAFAGDCQR